MDKTNAREIFKKNLEQTMAAKRINQADIVAALNVTASTVSDWALGKKYPRVDTMQRLADYLGVPMSALTAEARAIIDEGSNSWATPLVEAYAVKPIPTQKAVCNVLEIPYVKPGEIEEQPDNIVSVDFSQSDQRASAGRGMFLDDESVFTIKVRPDALPSGYRKAPDRYFGVPVAGDSMEPRFHDGDILIVSKEPVNVGDIGIFTMDGEGYVKELGRGVLHSLNEAYEDIPLTEDIRCNGAVIGVLDKSSIVDE